VTSVNTFLSELQRRGFKVHNENVVKWAKLSGSELLVFEIREG